MTTLKRINPTDEEFADYVTMEEASKLLGGAKGLYQHWYTGCLPATLDRWSRHIPVPTAKTSRGRLLVLREDLLKWKEENKNVRRLYNTNDQTVYVWDKKGKVLPAGCPFNSKRGKMI